MDGDLTFNISVERPKRWDFMVHRSCWEESDEKAVEKAVKAAFSGETEYN